MGPQKIPQQITSYVSVITSESWVLPAVVVGRMVVVILTNQKLENLTQGLVGTQAGLLEMKRVFQGTLATASRGFSLPVTHSSLYSCRPALSHASPQASHET